MKLAIHHRPGSFSERWIAYCDEQGIEYKIVNCYDSNIIEQLKDCDALMWQHNQSNVKDVLTAKRILFALEHTGFITFPDFKSGWHYDDKVAQKYLLEALGAPMVPSYVFYDKEEALNWINITTFPKVFKLKGGASAMNVSLVKNKAEARKKVNKAFGKGFSQFNSFGYFKDRLNRFRNKKETLLGVLKGFGRIFIPTEFAKKYVREKGYVYFQEFIPNNQYDIRLIVIGDKAYGMKRKVRDGDFRASGSGEFVYDPIPEDVIKIAFDVSERLGFQSMAFDFIYDENHYPLIVEISYGFGTKGSSLCPGYWDRDLNWHEGDFNPFGWMVENLIKKINQKK